MLQENILGFYFKDELDKQLSKVVLLEERYHSHKVEGKIKQSNFIEKEIIYWKERLSQGKLISFPKWYHCTKNASIVKAIANSEIKYLHQGVYAGAFVANYPEILYGSIGFALGDRIEETATKEIDSRGVKVKSKGITKRVYPRQSQQIVKPGTSITDPQTLDDKGTSFKDHQQGISLWYGFRRGIPIKRIEKDKNPLKYYKDTTVSYIFYDSLNYKKSQLEKVAKQLKVKCILDSDLNALRALISATWGFLIPENWKGKIESCHGF